MEEKKTTLVQSSINSGVMLGLVMVIYSVILFILDLWMNTWLGLVSFGLLIGGVIYATKIYRSSLGGLISYKNAFLVGLLTTVISGLITTIYSYLFITLINPDALEQIIAHSIEVLEKFSLPEEAMDKAVEQIENETTVSSTVKNGLISSVIGGVIISLITAAVMKKDPDMAEF